ncbi:MAG: hypothetical protein CL843_00190 [Crocinitomicaceae bacterium]|nr:hypothetical protein [Crocinitomicaceae bacterium]|tara:strand:+ start:1688 stop:2401 length:714 start_codon:yes stop_codon:yes gene_type:complete
MKKNLLVAFLAFFVAYGSYAQCTPDPNHTSELIYPDPSTLDSDIQVNLPYEEIITINVPADTTYLGATFTIDSLVVTNVSNVPTGIAFLCDPSSCSFPGNSSGCVQVAGTPTQLGTYDVNIDVSIYSGTLSLPYTETFTINVVNSTGIDDAEFSQGLSVYPNPTNGKVNLSFSSRSADQSRIQIFDVLGNTVVDQKVATTLGANTVSFDLSMLPKGQYFARLYQNDTVEITKILVTE